MAPCCYDEHERSPEPAERQYEFKRNVHAWLSVAEEAGQESRNGIEGCVRCDRADHIKASQVGNVAYDDR